MLLEEQGASARRSPWPTALLVLLLGIAIGALAEPRAWFDALRARMERRVESHRRLDPLLRPRTTDSDAVPDNRLVTLSIDIEEAEARRLQAVRERALRSGVIVQEESDTVPARLRWADVDGAFGEPLEADVRIKGDWLDHVASRKWSLRVELVDGALLGMRLFSIQHPGTRGFLAEWLIHQAAAREGILRPRSTFVNVLINGHPNGVYFLEEHFSKELLESQGRREGPIVRFDESDLWSARLENHIHYMHETPASVHVSSLPQNAPVEAFGEKRLSRSDGLARQLISALTAFAALQRDLRADPEVGEHEGALDRWFDVGALARTHALLSMFRGHHGAIWHNMRFYHSPITARLEPVLFDSGAGDDLDARPVPWVQGEMQVALDSSSDYYAGVFAELARMLDPDWVHDLFEAVEPDLLRYEAALLREGLPENRTVAALRARLLEQQRYLLGSIPSGRGLCAAVHPTGRGGPGDPREAGAAREVEVDLRCTSRVPILVREVVLAGGRTIPAREVLREGGSLAWPDGVVLRQSGPSARLGLSLSGTGVAPEPGALVGEVVFRPLHLARDEVLELRLAPLPAAAPALAAAAAAPDGPTLAEALARHACLGYEAKSDRLHLRAGTFVVDGDLVVPAGRTLSGGPGTRLEFAPGAVLSSTGALVLEGALRDPVVLTAQDPDLGWGGVRVADARARSRLEHVALRKVHGTPETGTPAALDFTGCNVTLRNMRIEGLAADVALSVSGGDLLIEGAAFADLPGDALHAVAVSGLVDRCAFERIRRDALVLYQSGLVLRQVRWSGVGGRALLAADGASIELFAGELDDVANGLVARAGSRISVADTSFGAGVRRDAAAWTEDAWPPSAITASALSLDGRPLHALVQHGSTLAVDGVEQPTSEVGPETLRAEGLSRR